MTALSTNTPPVYRTFTSSPSGSGRVGGLVQPGYGINTITITNARRRVFASPSPYSLHTKCWFCCDSLHRSSILGCNDGRSRPANLNPNGGNVVLATQLRSPVAISTGTKFTTSGCSVSATTGGASAGTYTSGTSGTCTVVITMAGATGSTAPNGWSCEATDETTVADLQHQTAQSPTTATIAGTTVSGDVINFHCIGY